MFNDFLSFTQPNIAIVNWQYDSLNDYTSSSHVPNLMEMNRTNRFCSCCYFRRLWNRHKVSSTNHYRIIIYSLDCQIIFSVIKQNPWFCPLIQYNDSTFTICVNGDKISNQKAFMHLVSQVFLYLSMFVVV